MRRKRPQVNLADIYRLFGRDASAKMEDLTARAGDVKEVKALAAEFAAADATSEELAAIVAERLQQRQDKGQLGTEAALDPEIEALLTVVLDKGDINDLLRNKGLSSLVGHELTRGGRAVEGADAKLIHRLFGDTDRAIDFANRVSEGSKRGFTHFSYMTTHDDEEHRRLTTAEPEDSDLREIKLAPGEESRERRMQHDTNAMRKYFTLKAQRLRITERELRALFYTAMEFEGREINNRDGLHKETKTRLNRIIVQLPSVQRAKKAGATPKQLARRIDEIRRGVAKVVDTYHGQRNRSINSENLKQPPRVRLGGHPGAWFQDAARDSYTLQERKFYQIDTAPSNVMYFGRTPTTRGRLESMKPGEARLFLSLADPRTIAAFRHLPNKMMLYSIVAEIGAEAQKARAAGHEKQALSIERRASEIKANLDELYAILERPPKGRETGEGARPKGRAGGTSQLWVVTGHGPSTGILYDEWKARQKDS